VVFESPQQRQSGFSRIRRYLDRVIFEVTSNPFSPFKVLQVLQSSSK